MSVKHLIKSKIEDLTGYFIHKRNDLPVGVSLKYDIQYKLKKIKITRFLMLVQMLVKL
jgi:hypothetical protein